MKLKTKVCALSLALTLGCSILAACGGKKTPSGDSTSNPADSTSQPADSTSAPADSTSTPAASTSTPAASTSNPATSTSAPVTKYMVTLPTSTDYTITGIVSTGYAEGEKVSFTVTVNNPDKEIVTVGYGTTTLTAKADGSYEFNMPANNVLLFVTTKNVERYVLSHTGNVQVDAGPVSFTLTLGTDPVADDFVLEAVSGGEHISISGEQVTGVSAGEVVLAAKIGGKEVARETFTVLASEMVSIKSALDAALAEAPCNGKSGNNSAKTTSNYTIGGQVVAMSNYDDSGSMSVVLDDGTAAALMIIYSSSKTAPEYTVGDSVKVTCKFTNYFGVLEGIGTASTATSQKSLYPDNLAKINKAYTPSLATAETMTGAQYLEYVALANANQSATAGAWTPLKRVNIAVTYDANHAMDNKGDAGQKGGYVIDGATEYAINGAELSRITLDAVTGHKSTLSGIMTGVNTNYKTSKLFVDTQTPLAVESVAFKDGDSKTIFLNNPVTLEYETTPEGSYGQATWTSSEPANVSVENGVITGLQQGSSTITVTVGGVSKSINVTVSGEQHVCESVALNKDSLALVKGASETLEATILPANCTDEVKWESTNTAAATVDQEGKVTAVAAGEADITVTCGSFSDTCHVTVRNQKLADLAHAKVNDPVDLYGYYVAKYPQDVNGMWVADGVAGAYLNRKPTGLNIGDIVHIVGTVDAYSGSKQIKATTCEKVDSYEGLSAQVMMNLDETTLGAIDESYQGSYATVTGKVTSNSVSNTGHRTVKLSVGEKSFTVYVHKTNCGDSIVEDFGRAAVGTTITAKGYISANKQNETDFTKITAAQYQFINPTLEDVQAPAITGIKLDKTTADVEQGKTLQLTASAEPDGATLPGEVTWTVEGNDKVTVSNAGLVTVAADAVAESTATVKATCGTYSAQCVITVKAQNAYVIAKATSIAVGDSLIMSAEAADGSYAKQFNGIITAGSNKIGEAVDYAGATPDAAKARLTVVAGSKEGTFALKLGDKYITWKSGNTLDEQDSVDDNASWTITFTDGVVTLANAKDATRKLQYNSGSPRFAAYTSAQKPVTLWKVTQNS